MMIACPGQDGTPTAIARAAVTAMQTRMPTLLAVSNFTHLGTTNGPFASIVDAAKADLGAERVALCEAATEWDHRNVALAWMRAHWPDVERIWIVDTDEAYTLSDFVRLKNAVEATDAGSYYVKRLAYWKGLDWRIDPFEPTPALVAIDPKVVPSFHWIRTPTVVGSKRPAVLVGGPLQHHATAVRSDEEMKTKIAAFGHGHEIAKDWFERKWLGWTPETLDLHPTHPDCWRRAVPASKEDLPEALQPLYDQFQTPAKLIALP